MIRSEPSRILIVGAHPDDEVLGFGASAFVLGQRGHVVTSCIVVGDADARLNRPADADLEADIHAAHEILGMVEPHKGSFPNIRLNTVPHIELVQFIERTIVETAPNLLVTHHPSDINDDHHHVSRATQTAARLAQRQSGIQPLDALLFMEVLSSTDWRVSGGSAPFEPQVYVEVGDDALDAKLAALAAYRDVMRPYPHPRSTESVTALATLRGSDSGLHLAEAFQLGFLNIRSGDHGVL